MLENEDQTIIQKELLEITIKAGRRLMQDFDHMLNEVPESEEKKMFQTRAKIWRDIFYPDNGGKNYRISLHNRIDNLVAQIRRLETLLNENGIIDTTNPF